MQEHDIDAGESFVDFMDDALQECAATICLFSSGYLGSRWCLKEAKSSMRLQEAFLNEGGPPHRFIPAVIEEGCRLGGILSSFVYLHRPITGASDLLKLARILDDVLTHGAELSQNPMAKGHLRWSEFITNRRDLNDARAFVGREDALSRLDGLMTGTHSETAITAVAGMGGVGKSYLALEWAKTRQASYQAVWWVNAEKSLVEDIAELGARLNHEQIAPLLTKPEMAAKETLNLLENQTGRPVLMVYDNVERFADIKDWRPAKGAHVLITSRSKSWPDYIKPMELDVLLEDDAVDLLLEKAPCLSREDAQRVAKELGYLPLALSLAAVVIEDAHFTAEQYLADLATYLED